MPFSAHILGAVSPGDNMFLVFALMFFLSAFVYLFLSRMALSPQGVSLIIFMASSLFVLFPVLTYSNNRDYILSSVCQWFILVIAVTWAIAIISLMRRPSADVRYPELRWRFVSQRTWLSFFAMVCVLDPIITIARFGKIGLMYGNETMGAGGSHADVMTLATTIGWECGSVASTMLQTDFLVSRLNYKTYLFQRRKWIDLGLVLFCLLCNSMTGNRFILMMNAVGFASGLALFNRLRAGQAAIGMIILMAFFTIVGNYRIGKVEIKDKLSFETQIKFIDSSIGWVATYSEPIFPTLDAFIHNAPSPAWGGVWFNAVAPTAVRGILLKTERTSPITEMFELLPHFGLTFRTMYADLLFDFGQIGSLLIGTLVLLLSISVYNRSTDSAWHLAVFINTFHMFSFMALMATFYTQIPFMSLVLLWLVSVPGRKEAVDIDGDENE